MSRGLPLLVSCGWGSSNSSSATKKHASFFSTLNSALFCKRASPSPSTAIASNTWLIVSPTSANPCVTAPWFSMSSAASTNVLGRSHSVATAVPDVCRREGRPMNRRDQHQLQARICPSGPRYLGSSPSGSQRPSNTDAGSTRKPNRRGGKKNGGGGGFSLWLPCGRRVVGWPPATAHSSPRLATGLWYLPGLLGWASRDLLYWHTRPAPHGTLRWSNTTPGPYTQAASAGPSRCRVF